MDKAILYPELIEYVFDYCSKFMTEKESKACWHNFAMEKSGNGKRANFYTHFKERNLVSFDPEVLDLLKNGFQSFRESSAAKIYHEHKDQLNLNLCPRCFKIARTSVAKQCRFCFYDWH